MGKRKYWLPAFSYPTMVLKGFFLRVASLELPSVHKDMEENDYFLMVFFAAFNSISVWQQVTLFMSFLGYTSTMPGLCSVLPKDTPTKKICGREALVPIHKPSMSVEH